MGQEEWRRLGMDHRPSTLTPFLLKSIASLLKQQSDQSGSEPSSEAAESIACKTFWPSRPSASFSPTLQRIYSGTIA